MPPEITAVWVKSLASCIFRWLINVEGSEELRKMPGVSVSRISFSALRAAAISPATVSALILYDWPSLSAATLAITGI